MDYNISDEELSKLVSNYSISEIIDGKVTGKGSSKIRVLSNRKRALEEKLKQGNYTLTELAYVNSKIEQKSKTRYWQNKFADENSLFKKQDVDSLDKHIENIINEYITPKVVPISKLAPNLLSEAAGSTKKVLGGIVIVIAGLLFAGGYLLGKHSNPKQPTTQAQVSGSYSSIANAYAEPVSEPVKEPILASEPVKEPILADILTAIQEQEAENKTNFIRVEPYPTIPTRNYTHETSKKSNLEHRLELVRLNRDEIGVSEYQMQLNNLIENKDSQKQKLTRSKTKTKSWFLRDIDDWFKDFLSPLRIDRIIKKKGYIKNLFSYHREHPIKALIYDGVAIETYSVIEAAEEGGAAVEQIIGDIGEHDGGLVLN